MHSYVCINHRLNNSSGQVAFFFSFFFPSLVHLVHVCSHIYISGEVERVGVSWPFFSVLSLILHGIKGSQHFNYTVKIILA